MARKRAMPGRQVCCPEDHLDRGAGPGRQAGYPEDHLDKGAESYRVSSSRCHV